MIETMPEWLTEGSVKIHGPHRALDTLIGLVTAEAFRAIYCQS